MLNNRKTREEIREFNSRRASHAANVRWQREHENSPCPIYGDPRPDEMYEFVMRNKMSGKEHTFCFIRGRAMIRSGLIWTESRGKLADSR